VIRTWGWYFVWSEHEVGTLCDQNMRLVLCVIRRWPWIIITTYILKQSGSWN